MMQESMRQEDTFRARVRCALADESLHVALERAVIKASTQREQAMASLSEAEALRDRARLIRAHTLGRLDQYLEQFVHAAEKAGAKIYFAANASEACRTVLEICQARSVRRAVKSKSMISEEIALNHELESVGIEVVESDLGEYIIQLAGERPSDILTPAMHKTREAIGQLFHEKLGIPITSDPGQLAAAARARLREVFLTAEVGISGVNLGVAETGTICTVTNEGNGRLSTTAPRTHIALMGIERLVPGLNDLNTILQLLARSATGQKLSVYTNLLTGPRRPGEPDGPSELHIVLIDNGRSRVLGTEKAEILYCIRCGACLKACPVFREIGGHAYGSVYPGPIGSVLTPALEGIGQWSDLVQASTLCGACSDVCPVRIQLPRLLLGLRDDAHRAGKTPVWQRAGLRFYREVVVHPKLYRFSIKIAGFVTRAIGKHRQGWLRWVPPPFSGWTNYRDFPAFAPHTLSEQIRARSLGMRPSRPDLDEP
jgi:L-lactate dehydrogenase complex protein LldF